MVQTSTDISDLATWCTVLKSELEHKRRDCQELRSNLQQAKSQVDSLQSVVAQRTAELTEAKSELLHVKDDVKRQVHNANRQCLCHPIYLNYIHTA